jgi:hypothetical protein
VEASLEPQAHRQRRRQHRPSPARTRPRRWGRWRSSVTSTARPSGWSRSATSRSSSAAAPTPRRRRGGSARHHLRVVDRLQHPAVEALTGEAAYEHLVEVRDATRRHGRCSRRRRRGARSGPGAASTRSKSPRGRDRRHPRPTSLGARRRTGRRRRPGGEASMVVASVGELPPEQLRQLAMAVRDRIGRGWWCSAPPTPARERSSGRHQGPGRRACRRPT